MLALMLACSQASRQPDDGAWLAVAVPTDLVEGPGREGAEDITKKVCFQMALKFGDDFPSYQCYSLP